MKATLATLACLLTVGFLSAAEVAGNNTAVVIRKNVVKSDNDYQFLCVPVDGLSIDGTAKNTVKLSTVLPPATLSTNAYVTLGSETYTIAVIDGVKQWAQPSEEDTEVFVAKNPDLEGGAIFWLYDESDNNQTIVFCGQDRDRDLLEQLGRGVVPLKNDSSVQVALNEAVNMSGFVPQHGDQILTIQANDSDYTIYQYLNGEWYGPGFNNKCGDTAFIAPGEAFYYYNVTADGVVGDNNTTDGE